MLQLAGIEYSLKYFPYHVYLWIYMLHDTRTLCAFFNYKGDIKMCGFLVVGSEEFELQVFQKALDENEYFYDESTNQIKTK